jgi:hypothetical protein
VTQPDQIVDFPTLFVAADWIEAHCVVPDGFDKGEPFGMVDWQLWAVLNFYRLRPDAKLGDLSTAFHYRRSQIVLPQKAGKAPYTAAHVCNEAVGPALFAGWAHGGETWDCRDHGCGCGWVYEYEEGEAMGQPWPTPLIQITAYSEDQTDNIYDALRPMIDDGPLHELMPKTGEEFIRIGKRGRIDVVTSNALSRLGQRVTFVPQDETGIWLKSNSMIKVAETQRRGLAGMGGRSEETTNAWDPSEESVAQRTASSERPDIFRIHPEAPISLSYKNKRERRKIHQHVYRGCKWINLDAIESEAAELLETDPAQAERFFGNRAVAGDGRAFNSDKWDELATDYRPEKGALITLGIDGARFVDSLAIIATEVETGFQWPVGIWERPETAPDDYEHPMGEVDGAIEEAIDDFKVWRAYVDPGSNTGNIDTLMEKWQGRWGGQVFVPWRMDRPRQTAEAVVNFKDAIATGEVTHDGDEIFSRHIRNSVRRKVNPKDEDGRPLHVISKDRTDSPNKIDAAAAAVISWEARGDAIAENAEPDGPSQVWFT